MQGRSAVLFLVDDRYRTGSEHPLMLHPVMGVPLLKWLTHALSRAGVNRFFLACAQDFSEAAKACFPADADLTDASDDAPADRLHVFLSTAPDGEEDLLAVAAALILSLVRGTPTETDAGLPLPVAAVPTPAPTAAPQ